LERSRKTGAYPEVGLSQHKPTKEWPRQTPLQAGTDSTSVPHNGGLRYKVPIQYPILSFHMDDIRRYKHTPIQLLLKTILRKRHADSYRTQSTNVLRQRVPTTGMPIAEC
jgi:hypothetical protein